jgi:hypothetical protein
LVLRVVDKTAKPDEIRGLTAGYPQIPQHTLGALGGENIAPQILLHPTAHIAVRNPSVPPEKNSPQPITAGVSFLS